MEVESAGEARLGDNGTFNSLISQLVYCIIGSKSYFTVPTLVLYF